MSKADVNKKAADGLSAIDIIDTQPDISDDIKKLVKACASRSLSQNSNTQFYHSNAKIKPASSSDSYKLR